MRLCSELITCGFQIITGAHKPLPNRTDKTQNLAQTECVINFMLGMCNTNYHKGLLKIKTYRPDHIRVRNAPQLDPNLILGHRPDHVLIIFDIVGSESNPWPSQLLDLHSLVWIKYDPTRPKFVGSGVG